MLLTAVIGACLMGGISTANATATLRLTSSDATVVTVTDGVAGDANLAVTGAVTYIGTVGANWIVNTSTGLTYPVSGYSTANGHLDLNSVNVSTGAGSLTMEFSEIGFDSLSAVENWLAHIGGTMATGASVQFKVWAGSGLFNHGTLISDSGVLTGSPFLNDGSGAFGPSSSHAANAAKSIRVASRCCRIRERFRCD